MLSLTKEQRVKVEENMGLVGKVIEVNTLLCCDSLQIKIPDRTRVRA